MTSRSGRDRDGASAWMRFALTASQMNMAAHEVIFRRTMMMSQGAMSAPEAVGMVLEKCTTFATAMEKATIAAARGAHPARVATAALHPIGRKVRANARRLRR